MESVRPQLPKLVLLDRDEESTGIGKPSQHMVNGPTTERFGSYEPSQENQARISSIQEGQESEGLDLESRLNQLKKPKRKWTRMASVT